MMKITGGKFKGRKIIAPDENIVRPTLSKTREAIFSSLFSLIDFEEKLFLDMFAGSGIMGIEAISRGFEAVCFEKNLKVVNILKKNYSSINVEPNLKVGNSLNLIKKIDKKFDVIFIDPPYMSGIYEDCLDAIKLHNNLNPDGIIILEHLNKINWNVSDFKIVKEKTYSNKSITFLKLNERD